MNNFRLIFYSTFILAMVNIPANSITIKNLTGVNIQIIRIGVESNGNDFALENVPYIKIEHKKTIKITPAITRFNTDESPFYEDYEVIELPSLNMNVKTLGPKEESHRVKLEDISKENGKNILQDKLLIILKLEEGKLTTSLSEQ